MNELPDEKFEMWARVDLFGHTVRVGKLSVANTGVEVLYRLDIPTPEGFATKFFGKGAIYSIDPMTEAAARVLAERMGPPAPISQWDLPDEWKQAIYAAKAKALPAPSDPSEGTEDDEDDER